MCHARKLSKDEGSKVDRNILSKVFARIRNLNYFIFKTMRSY